MMKKICALILIMALLPVLAGCGADSDRIAQLEAENAALKAQVAELTQKLEGAATDTAVLSRWQFVATAWEDGSGAAVTFTATPENYEPGQTLQLEIWLEGDLIDSVSCQWNGTAFEAAAQLAAADGYCYYCTVTDSTGAETEVELNTPKNPVEPAVIDLETALTAYCAMMVEESGVQDGVLTVTAGYVQVQLPLIGCSGGPVEALGAELVLRANGSETQRRALVLKEETETALTGEIIGTAFDLPQLEEGLQLELWLEVPLSDGRTLFTTGGTWYCSEGQLVLVVG